jgi:hypothetical protein
VPNGRKFTNDERGHKKGAEPMNFQRANMRTIFLVTVALLLTGCGLGPSSTKSDNAKSADGRKAGASKAADAALGPEITEAQLGVPFYPGATKVEHSNVVLSGDGKKTYAQSWTTDDDVLTVAEFYRTEGAKVGKIGGLSENGSADLSIVSIGLNDGRVCQVTLAKTREGKTQIHILTTDPKT